MKMQSNDIIVMVTMATIISIIPNTLEWCNIRPTKKIWGNQKDSCKSSGFYGFVTSDIPVIVYDYIQILR